MPNYGSLSTKTESLDTFTIDGMAYPFTPRTQLDLVQNQQLMRVALWQNKVDTTEGDDVVALLANAPEGELLAIHNDLVALVPQLLRTAPDELLDSLFDQGRREIVSAFLSAVAAAMRPKVEDVVQAAMASETPTPIGAAPSRASKPSTAATRRAGNALN